MGSYEGYLGAILGKPSRGTTIGTTQEPFSLACAEKPRPGLQESVFENLGTSSFRSFVMRLRVMEKKMETTSIIGLDSGSRVFEVGWAWGSWV